MKKIRLGLVAMAVVGAGVGSTPGVVAQDTNQCWRREGFDPPGACTACYDLCMGTGYKCCKIVVVSAPLQ